MAIETAVNAETEESYPHFRRNFSAFLADYSFFGVAMAFIGSNTVLPSEAVSFREHGMTLLADVVVGQKTGMFLDHRPGRRKVREISSGLRVLNLFGYTGGFSIAAGLGGAKSVVTVDSAQFGLMSRIRGRVLGSA